MVESSVQNALSVLIVEDEPSFALELEMLVEEIGYRVSGVVDNSASALEMAFAGEVDFILMDIDIKGKMNGLDVGQKISHLNIPVLFITSISNEAHYEKALKSNFMGYLVKPVDKYTLRTAIGLSFSKLMKGPRNKNEELVEEFIQNNYLFIRRNKVYEKVSQQDIVLVEGANDYVNLLANDGRKFLVRKTMKAMEDLLADWTFYRVHRSYIVNLKSIDSIDFLNNELVVLDRVVPISRHKKLELERVVRKLD